MQITIDLLTNRDEIYKALLESEDSQSIIGIASEELGPGMFMTSVKDVLHDNSDCLVVLNSYDVTGYFLEKNKISLSKIKSVIPFKAVFTNPFLKGVNREGYHETPVQKDLDFIF